MVTYLAAIVICVFLVRGIIYIVQKLKKTNGISLSFDKTNWVKYLTFFFGGLFANAVPHFVLGISGEFSPAPFGQYLGKGFPEYLSNVIWGFINIVLGYNLFVSRQVSSPSKLGKNFFTGILVMGIFLPFVFSHFNQ